MSRSQLSLVGAFAIGGVILFAVGIFMIGDRRMLFAERFEIESDFGTVTGVQVGTIVRVTGFNAGEVLGIELPDNPSGRFMVRMRVREDLHRLIRTDSVAGILTDGLLGNVFIQIAEGSDTAHLVPAGGTIRGIDPIQFSDLIEEGRDTFRTVAGQLLDMQTAFRGTMTRLDGTIDAATAVVEEVGTDVQAITTATAGVMNDAQAMSTDIRGMVTDVRNGGGAVGRLLTDDTLYEQATGVVARLEEAATAAGRAAGEAGQILADFRAPDSVGQQMLADMGGTVARAQAAMSDLAENTEALKHNWMFRGFFEDRGFFNLDAMTVIEYRELLASETYEPLRLWIGAERLFTTGADGEERLTDDGRRRLNSAMAQFIDYPPGSPLVIEGYTTVAGRDAQYLRARAWSTLVRDHLVVTFGRDITVTGTMPIGAEAVGGPRDDGTWDGVALTLFATPEAIATVAGAGP